MPGITKSQALEVLNRLLKTITRLKSIRQGSPEFSQWQTELETAVKHIFTNDVADKLERVRRISYSLWVIGSNTTEGEFQAAYLQGLEEAGGVLKAFIREVELYWQVNREVNPDAILQPQQTYDRMSVFLIHGRDHGARDIVASFLRRLGVEVVILGEKPDEGKTIIEKFERHSGVQFAVAVFTPDDLGGLAGDGPRPRTRQNVIFEFGYFIGKLGRENVRALVKGELEVPSDYSGVLYVPLDDSESWKLGLIRELRSAGFDVDANDAL